MNLISVFRPSVLPVLRLLLVAAGLAFAGTLLDLPGLSSAPAWAKDGADDGGSHDSGDDRGGGGQGQDDGGGGQASGGSGSNASGSGSGSSSACDNAAASLDLRYADGFHEHVSDCTYVLTDQEGRVVITRAATRRDLERLQQR